MNALARSFVRGALASLVAVPIACSSGGDAGSPSDGGATGSDDASPDGAASSDGAANDARANDDGGITLANPAPGSKLFIGANFWNIDWEGASDFFVSGVDFATTTNPWRPELLADLAPYHVLRFMDWNLTNDSSNPQAVWTTRKQKTQPQTSPVAFEWQIDLCNRTKKDYWLNVPHESDAAYWKSLATLVRDALDPSLRVYVEWSNEVWNGGFPARAYAESKGAALNLAGADKSASYYVYASVRVFEAFEAAFGKGSPRLVRVIAGQAAYDGPCQNHMKALADATINPNGTKPDAYAIAPYFSGASVQTLHDQIPTTAQWTRDEIACASARALPVISYEGGSDSFAAGNGCTALQHDPAMHDLYTQYLDAHAAAGLEGPFMQYTHAGACWGLEEKTNDSLAVSPKYRGVLDWIAAHP